MKGQLRLIIRLKKNQKIMRRYKKKILIRWSKYFSDKETVENQIPQFVSKLFKN